MLQISLKYLQNPKKYQKNKLFLIKISFLLTIGTGINLAFSAILIPLIIFILLEFLFFKKIINKYFSGKIFIYDLLLIILFSFLILLPVWPQTHSNILVRPFKIYALTLSIYRIMDFYFLKNYLFLKSSMVMLAYWVEYSTPVIRA